LLNSILNVVKKNKGDYHHIIFPKMSVFKRSVW